MNKRLYIFGDSAPARAKNMRREQGRKNEVSSPKNRKPLYPDNTYLAIQFFNK
jgi:hypothetical protein